MSRLITDDQDKAHSPVESKGPTPHSPSSAVLDSRRVHIWLNQHFAAKLGKFSPTVYDQK